MFFTTHMCKTNISIILYAFKYIIVTADALNNFDGGTRMVTGPKATAGIWATYPQEFASVYTCLGDQVETK